MDAKRLSLTILQIVFLLAGLEMESVGAMKGVLVRNKTLGQLTTSSLLTWETFQQKDSHVLFEYAVYGGEYKTTREKAYICRSDINNILVTGYVIRRFDAKNVCVVSMHGEVKTKGVFDLLLNKGNGAKLKWVPFENVFQNIDGTVSTVSGGAKDVYYIARHKNHTLEGHEVDHAIGWFDPQDGFGKIHALVGSSEKIFEIGEILAVTEAVRYELYDMKFKTFKLQEKKERRLLGQTILKNEGDEEMDVQAVIGYEYNVTRYLGFHDGIARSINTTVFVAKEEPFSFLWGIQKNDHVVSSKSVGTMLKPGTAINVTLWGNYTILEGPYTAQQIVYWADGTHSKKRRIDGANGYEADMKDLEIEESATYWLHNNTIVPTTTQRTTSVSSTTNKSIFSSSISSNAIEKITPKTVMDVGSAVTGRDAMDDDTENEISDGLKSGSSKALCVTFSTIVIVALSSLLLA